MEFIKTKLEGVLKVKPNVIGDERGFFLEGYHRDQFFQNGIAEDFVQDNHSGSKQGTLRGLHLQRAPMGQGKLVRVIKGEIFDVAVDIRPESKTLGQWVGAILSDQNHEMLYIPPDFAHGFYVLEEDSQIIYKCTNTYAPELEATIKWDDTDINIDWPLLKGSPLILSKKDQNGLALKDFTESFMTA
jgi:dTDP-4-dehydrorhamnose 3,5-epimerase